MQFELNNSMYVLQFVAAEGRWYLVAPTETGSTAIPVATDGHTDLFLQAELPEFDKQRVN